jgi:hypothetical protein
MWVENEILQAENEILHVKNENWWAENENRYLFNVQMERHMLWPLDIMPTNSKAT